MFYSIKVWIEIKEALEGHVICFMYQERYITTNREEEISDFIGWTYAHRKERGVILDR